LAKFCQKENLRIKISKKTAFGGFQLPEGRKKQQKMPDFYT
jgi:hypothetical protein